jgi:Predicted signal transduction protein with a C-terminal ATPase domain
MKMFRRSSLRYKLIVFLLASIVLPISISILITYLYTKESVKTYYVRENSSLIRQGAVNLINYMDRINEASLLIYNNLSDPNSMFQLIQNGSQSYLEEREMYRILQLIANSVQEIEQIYLYSAAENISYRYAYNLLRSSPGQTHEPTLDPERDVRIEAVHRSHEYGIAKPKFPYHLEKDVFSFHRKITEAPTDRILGVISIDIRTDMIREIGEMLYTPGSEELYIFDDAGSVIFASEPTALKDGELAWAQNILEREPERGSFHFEDAQFDGIHIYEKLSTPWMEWTMVKRIPYETLYRDARQLTLINSLVVSLFLIIAAIAALYISYRFTNPIKQLIRYINKIETGNMDADIDIHRTDEIGILAKRFHQLMQRINQLIIREYRLELASKTNQLKALQAQVNPHFMNNALQSIGTLALQNGDRKVYSLISSLGKMMRYHMRADSTSVPLSAELDYVRSYLALQRQRFDENLHYHIEADERAGAVRVPKMILQPLVENVFKHGIQPALGPGEIDISCRMAEPSLLEIRVADNGAGMEEEERIRLQAVLDRTASALEPDGEEGGRIGLINILSRLRLYFNDQVQMKLENRTPRGLRVTITIPLSEEEEAADEGVNRG